MINIVPSLLILLHHNNALLLRAFRFVFCSFYKLVFIGVEKTADAEEIKKAFRKSSLIWHPDKNPAPDATSKFQELQEAYRVLSDTQERAWYDRHRDQILRGGQRGIGGDYTEERLDVFKYFARSCFTDFDDGPNVCFNISFFALLCSLLGFLHRLPKSF